MMSDRTATAVSCPNIAFIKYWGNRDPFQNIPANGSISMNLGGLYTHTRVCFDSSLAQDQLTLNGDTAGPRASQRVSDLLDRIRNLAGVQAYAQIESSNNFPTGTGIASSASGFSALALAGSRAAGLDLSEAELSRLARTASGSACRSIPAGFVEWQAGEDDRSSFAFTIAPPDHWQLVDCIAIISQIHKPTTSQEGHDLADTSPLQSGRIASSTRRLELCRSAILNRDFDALAEVIELDSNLMHAVMMTSKPALFYWKPGTITVMENIREWRKSGLSVCYTIDAGPNVHVICLEAARRQVVENLERTEGVQRVLTATPGGQAHLVQGS